MRFRVGQIVVARDEFMSATETLEDTAGVVLEYHEDVDRLRIGTIHPERYVFGSAHLGAGEWYRLATREEVESFNITAFEVKFEAVTM